MRNHQQTDPDTATIAKLGDATFENAHPGSIQPWIEKHIRNEWFTTEQLQCYGATFWKKIEPEPGHRLVEDHERVGEKPAGCRVLCKDGSWNTSYAVEWADENTYAVPIEKVVAWLEEDAADPLTGHVAYFANQEDRDRAVEKANKREL